AGALVVLGGEHDVGDMDGALALDNGALGMLLALAGVALDHLEPLDQDALFARIDLQNFPAPAQFGPGDDHDLVSLFDMCSWHNYRTSGASEMIFMNFFSLNSRATGPKMRVPR